MLEELIEEFIEEGVKAYKKLNKNSLIGQKLFLKEPVEIQEITFTGYREFTVYKMGEYIKEHIPECKVEVNLDENNSSLILELSDAEEEILINTINQFLGKVK